MSRRRYYERRDPFTGELLDCGPESQPDAADGLINQKIADRERKSQRGHLLGAQESSTTQSAKDVSPSPLAMAATTDQS